MRATGWSRRVAIFSPTARWTRSSPPPSLPAAIPVGEALKTGLASDSPDAIFCRRAQRRFSHAVLSIWEEAKILGKLGAMTSVAKRIGLVVACAALAQVATSAAIRPSAAPPHPSRAPPSAPIAPPAGLRDQLIEIARNFDGKAGIAVISLRDGWEI